MPRLFFALWPDAATRTALAHAAALVAPYGGRRVRPEHLHVTLAFLGAVPVSTYAALLSAPPVPDVPSFKLHIALAGWWRASRVTWLAPSSVPAPLLALHEVLRSRGLAYGLPAAREAFRPHVTVARATRRGPRVVACAVDWQVVDFALIESCSDGSGTRYEVRRRWPLGAPPRD